MGDAKISVPKKEIDSKDFLKKFLERKKTFKNAFNKRTRK